MRASKGGKRALTYRYEPKREIADGNPGEDTYVVVLLNTSAAVLKAADGGNLEYKAHVAAISADLVNAYAHSQARPGCLFGILMRADQRVQPTPSRTRLRWLTLCSKFLQMVRNRPKRRLKSSSWERARSWRTSCRRPGPYLTRVNTSRGASAWAARWRSRV